MSVEPVPTGAREFFGEAWAGIRGFAEVLVEEGELRGLIGPRELPRLWSRHLLNSAAVAEFVPRGSRFADVGSGAGFPGVVVALMRPDLDVYLVEPMERRTVWLSDVADRLKIENMSVIRARAEELHGEHTFDAVGARAVAAMKKLIPWVGPLIGAGGRLVALKGERAQQEVDDAQKVLRKHGLRDVRVHEVLVPGTTESTRVVEALRTT